LEGVGSRWRRPGRLPRRRWPDLLSPTPPPSLQLTYSTFIAGLKRDNITLNRVVLAELAAGEPASFAALCARVAKMKGLPVGE